MFNFLEKYILNNQFLITVFFVALALLLYRIIDILFLLFIAYILMAGLLPVVNKLEKRFPKSLSILIPYFITVLFITFIIFSLVPFFVSQAQSMFKVFPTYIKEIFDYFQINIDPGQLTSMVSPLLSSFGNVLEITNKIFDVIFSLFLVFVISFYFILYEKEIKSTLVNFFPKNLRGRIENVFIQAEKGMGDWLRGQLVLSAFVGLLTFLGLSLLGLNFALPLAIIAAILEIVPNFGPIISFIIVGIVAFNVSFSMFIKAAILSILIQQIENNLLVPKIMQKAVGLNPLVVILGIIIGGKLLGLLGALLAIPIISLLWVIYKNLCSKH